MLRGEVSPEAKAKAERAASAAGISLAWLLELLILNAPVDASGKMIDLPDREDPGRPRACPPRPAWTGSGTGGSCR